MTIATKTGICLMRIKIKWEVVNPSKYQTDNPVKAGLSVVLDDDYLGCILIAPSKRIVSALI